MFYEFQLKLTLELVHFLVPSGLLLKKWNTFLILQLKIDIFFSFYGKLDSLCHHAAHMLLLGTSQQLLKDPCIALIFFEINNIKIMDDVEG